MICHIEQWFTENYLNFNSSKCKYIVVSRKRAPLVPDVPLLLFGSALERVDSYKYLGVLLSDDLSWSLQVKSVCQKAWCILGLLYRRFYGLASQESLKQLYLSLMRPHLEYACQVWDPHLSKDKNALEKVQKFACKLATSKWDSSYNELLSLLYLKPLQERRVELKLGLMFKLVHKLRFFPDNSWSHCTNNRSSRNYNTLQLSRPLARTNAYICTLSFLTLWLTGICWIITLSQLHPTSHLCNIFARNYLLILRVHTCISLLTIVYPMLMHKVL